MTPTERERIEKDADELLRKYWPADNFLNEGRKKWYIAGATSEHDKARNQAIDEALQKVKELKFAADPIFQVAFLAVMKELESLKTIS